MSLLWGYRSTNPYVYARPNEPQQTYDTPSPATHYIHNFLSYFPLDLTTQIDILSKSYTSCATTNTHDSRPFDYPVSKQTLSFDTQGLLSYPRGYEPHFTALNLASNPNHCQAVNRLSLSHFPTFTVYKRFLFLRDGMRQMPENTPENRARHTRREA